MRIINIMTSKTLGGIEQAFLDYNEALTLSGHQILALIHRKSKIKTAVKKQNINVEEIYFSKYNYAIIIPLYIKFKKFSPDVIITHSKKTIPILRILANLLKIPLIGVSHNPKYKLIDKCDVIFSITQNQKDIFKQKGFPEKNIYVIPNLISKEIPYKIKTRHTPPVIGSMGRFDPMKGFDTYLKALGILKQKGLSFSAVLGGEPQSSYPQEKEKYIKIIQNNKLKDHVELIGWVKDKAQFFQNIDIFVLSSNYEPFGIVLLEAMQASVPIITSDTEGPNEIFKNHKDSAYIFNKGNAQDLAEKMEEAIKNTDKTQQQAQKAWQLCKKKYTLFSVAKTLDNAIKEVIRKL